MDFRIKAFPRLRIWIQFSTLGFSSQLYLRFPV